MGWADFTILALLEGKQANCTPHGGSMKPHVHSGQKVTLEPCTAAQAQPGDIVLCKVQGNQYLHFVKATRLEGGTWRCLIANARGRENGWTAQVFGRLVKSTPE